MQRLAQCFLVLAVRGLYSEVRRHFCSKKKTFRLQRDSQRLKGMLPFSRKYLVHLFVHLLGSVFIEILECFVGHAWVAKVLKKAAGASDGH